MEKNGARYGKRWKADCGFGYCLPSFGVFSFISLCLYQSPCTSWLPFLLLSPLKCSALLRHSGKLKICNKQWKCKCSALRSCAVGDEGKMSPCLSLVSRTQQGNYTSNPKVFSLNFTWNCSCFFILARLNAPYQSPSLAEDSATNQTWVSWGVPMFWTVLWVVKHQFLFQPWSYRIELKKPF